MIQPSEALRDDVNLLGESLGIVLSEQLGDELYQSIEHIRQLSKQARRGDKAADAKLKDTINQLTLEQINDIARAFSHFMNLANVAESYHQVRQINTESGIDSEIMPDIRETLSELKRRSDIEQSEVKSVLDNLKIELVLTAHPTEIKRRTLIFKLQRISEILERRDRTELTTKEDGRTKNQLLSLITAIWQTEDMRHTRPTPLEEAQWGMTVVENSLWTAVPAAIRVIDNAREEVLNETPKLEYSPIRFASWMGGDRDGNPNVTATVTQEVVQHSRLRALALYRKTIIRLIQRLSMRDCSPTLRQHVPDAIDPYRSFLSNVLSRIETSIDVLHTELKGLSVEPSADVIHDVSEILDPLMVCYHSLNECKGQRIANALVWPAIKQAQCFGLSLLPLDIRQEASRHSDVLSAITQHLDLGDYNSWSEDERGEFCLRECQAKRPLLPTDTPFSPDEQEVLDSLAVIAEHSKDMGAYVISMCAQASDILAVMLLQKIAGVKKPLRVVPLFETLDDLNRAASVMDALFLIDWYAKACNGKQEVMIGYSDSSKDAGKLAANWAQYKSQAALVAVAKKHEVELTLFHGRGGSIGRGGGPLQAALQCQPPGALDGRMRVTEQGEVIQQKFGLMPMAIRQLEGYVAAVTAATVRKSIEVKPEWEAMMDQLSADSVQAYRAVVKDNPQFVEYFREVTPEQVLGRLCISSRPAKRRAQGGIESLRAIPWVFAWTQNRLMLPVWLGINAAFGQALANKQEEQLIEMIKEWPFFTCFIDLIDMVLVKADEHIAAYYHDNLASKQHEELGQGLFKSITELRKHIAQLMQNSPHSESRAAYNASIALRNTYADPLNYLQVECSKRLKNDALSEVEQSQLDQALMTTISGLSAAMKNTG